MQTDYNCAWNNYEIYLKQEKKSKIENNNQKFITGEEINGVKILIIWENPRFFLEKESFLKMQDAEKKNDKSFVKKANALKRSRDETDDEIKTLQKTLVSLEEKRSNM